MASRWRSEGSSEINLAPLLDVIFSLLFFFVLATSLRQDRQAMEVALPESGESAALDESLQNIEIVITQDNEVLFQDKPVDVENLSALLQEERAAIIRSGAQFGQAIIRSDGKADVEVFVDVSDACARAGIPSAMMETLPRRDE
ncbi:MAG: ExbD/TolR family protein [Candidatus Sumerlaeia bacterium]